MSVEHTKNGPPAVPWNNRDVLLGLGLVVIGTFLVSVLLGLLEEDDASPLTTLALVLLQGLMLGVVWRFSAGKYSASWETLGLTRPQGRWSVFLPWLALGGSLGFSSLYAVVITTIGADFMLPPELPASALGDGTLRAANVIVIGALGPLAEEVFFRGFMLAALVGSLGAFRGVMVGSAIFAISHGVIAMMVPVFVSGLLLSWLYLRTRSIWAPFTAHAAQNFLVLALTT